jgi:ABC-type transport system involved in multi-copper enzyme maturation permease subunit
VSQILDKSNLTEVELLYTRVGTNGTAPPETDVYYKYTSVVPSYQELQRLNESQMQFLGKASGFTSVLQRPPPPVGNATTIIVGAFTSSGALLSIQPTQYSAVQPPSTILATILTLDLAFFVPVAGILVAYGAYGRERLNGVLESILTRPVSRRALATSRYVSVTLALAVASVVVVEAFVLLSGILIGFSFGASAQTGLLLGAFIEAMAYAGIVFVLSRLFKSTALVLGIAAGLYFLTNFIPFFMSAGGSLPSWLNYLLPGRYVAMCVQYFMNFNFGVAVGGITAFTLAGGAALWLALPFAAFFYLAVKRD